MIVGTAGHIDHGKTTLVRALTGVDTDRLKEEKARGITIELGYAYVAFEGGVLGFVDVPGHERLIHTMVAGACGIDFVLLAIAADDGVMPQTREHLAIVDWLGIRSGAVAVTKCDRVDAALLRQRREEIGTWLAGTVLADAPVFEVSATQDGDSGVAALNRHLRGCAIAMRGRSHDGLFRLAIDRVFTLAGAGTVVTGTVFDGCVKVGDEVWLAPSGETARVRSLHAYNREADIAYAGDRCALNLSGILKDRIARGDWVVCERLATGARRLDVELRLLDDAAVDLHKDTPVHVHLGTMHRVARAVAIDDSPVSEMHAKRIRAQLVFDEPVHAIAGDRFIVRDAGAVQTIGGGRVLDPDGPARKRKSPERVAWLDAFSRWLDTRSVRSLIEQAPYGVRRSWLERSLGVECDAMDLPADVIVIAIKGERGHDDWLIARSRWSAVGNELIDVLRNFHQTSPDEQGVDSARLRRMAALRIDESLWRMRVKASLDSAEIERSGSWLHLPGFVVVLTDEEERCAERVLCLLHERGVEPAWVRDIACTVGLPEDDLRALLRKLARRGSVYQIVRDLFYHRDAMCDVAHVVEEVASAAEGRVTAAAFRDATGLGRKRAIQVLEFFDRVGYTRFWRDGHVLRDGARGGERF